jgi:hypothetical protein
VIAIKILKSTFRFIKMEFIMLLIKQKNNKGIGGAILLSYIKCIIKKKNYEKFKINKIHSC